MRHLSLIVLGATIALLTVVARGQDNAPSVQASASPAGLPVIPKGTYEPFGAWQHLQLGATTLVNPKIAENSAVVNAYAAPEALAGLDAEQFAAKYKAGQLVVAMKADGSRYEVLPASADPASVFQALKAGKEKQAIVLSYERLGTARPSKFINWADKTQPF